MPATTSVPLFLATVSGLFLVLGFVGMRRHRWIGATSGMLLGVATLSLAAVLLVAFVATKGYRALTREDVAATVTTEPVGPKTFRATFEMPDGTRTAYDLRGDALYVDGHIVKWHPIANVLGLHTAYRLDRVAGRYETIEDERTLPRTVHPLANEQPIDIFRLTRRYAFLAPIVDAEYGSATFVSGRERARFEIRVSTTGLMARRVSSEASASR